ncbi:hypothetical protein A4R26_06270 [Niastella populi]|uniref:Uncharacterized protein n=1 Tax=Niastella populi TaxID=550983 RepID=A0A1V9F599_9BACT|nr:hypothetical protein A4R26_06270 [Niastella populi]
MIITLNNRTGKSRFFSSVKVPIYLYNLHFSHLLYGLLAVQKPERLIAGGARITPGLFYWVTFW